MEAARIPSCVVPFNTQCKYCNPSRQLTSLALWLMVYSLISVNSFTNVTSVVESDPNQ